ncbi:gliding motility-associated C-terminal domain-containing protein [uncultured Draconibacterium sp.]|uniref:T9SS type B sorting domain-containing protein n=1 Tax=uncultured Draconibacterium sp. TaxID=1573823 RepID=UPI00326033D9
MILTLLAALNGAAQQDIVEYEGAETTHHVVNHPGSEYHWEIFKSLNPAIPADPTECYFTDANDVNEITVHWLQAGRYYLTVVETDASGCTNLKALAVSILPNNRSIRFFETSSNDCFNSSGNDFNLSLVASDIDGEPLKELFYPLTVSFLVNGNLYAQQVEFDNQALAISSAMFTADSDLNNTVEVEITGAVDNENNTLATSAPDVHSRIIYPKPQLAFDVGDLKLERNTVYTHEVAMIVGNLQGARYFWSVDPPEGTSADLESNFSNEADIVWDGISGDYTLQVYAIDGNGCSSDTAVQRIGILKTGYDLIFSAGIDTLTGSCSPFKLQATVSDTSGLIYSWIPIENLDDPTQLNPVFTPGNTTEFILTVSNADGVVGKDTVEIGVAEISADAGDDFMLEDGTTALLNGMGSSGQQIEFNWTTSNGTFVGGQNTATPEISSAGTYYLQVSDIYGCAAIDSVVVSRFISAPIARDVYDTTNYEKTITIAVLANDEDPQGGELNPASLEIVQHPVNGTANINQDATVTYRPDDGFLGGDVFEYRICNYFAKCDNAHVYVYVMALDFFIPEAFTPNGDNINDFFEIQGIEMFEGNSITIINRWGKKVYEAQNYGLSTIPVFWDGKSNQGGGNSDLPTGTYFYVLDLGNGEQPIAGSVYIDR